MRALLRRITTPFIKGVIATASAAKQEATQSTRVESCERRHYLAENAKTFGCNLKQPAIYIVASQRNGTLYTGVTSNLALRAFQHREGALPGFTRQYNCKMLVFYEYYEDMPGAIAREKQIKGGSRKAKLALIEAMNPTWRDLYEDLAQ